MLENSQRKILISEQLLLAIEWSGKSCYRIAQETGVDQSVLSRFVNGKAGLTLSTIDRLATHLDLALGLREGSTAVEIQE